jgi:hypothetical protein
LTHFLEDCIGYITRLKVLSIRGFSKELEAFPAGIINSIQHLSRSFEIPRIYGWDKLSVPRQLQHLAALEKLFVENFRGKEFEEALPDWLANLSSLQYLQIVNCKNVKHLGSSTPN